MDGAKACSLRTFGRLRAWGFIANFITMRPTPIWDLILNLIRIHEKDALRMRIRNQNNHLHFPVAEAGLSPTHFQADTFPSSFRERITVQHDGIDTDLVAPKPDAAWNWILVSH